MDWKQKAFVYKWDGGTGILPVDKIGNRPVKSKSKKAMPVRVWLDESFDRILRDGNELQEKMNYIVNNPVESGLADSPQDYKWLYIQGLFDEESQARMLPATFEIKYSGDTFTQLVNQTKFVSGIEEGAGEKNKPQEFGGRGFQPVRGFSVVIF